MPVAGGSSAADVVLAGTSGIRAPAEVFNSIFVVFLGLGTLVGVVVITYTLYNAYKYRYREEEDPAPDANRPELGELPEGGGKGKKLFLSFGLSAIIVLSLIVWTYASLLYIETGAAQAAEDDVDGLDVAVEGYQFGWDFTYPNGHTQSSVQDEPLRVPEDTVINLTVTSADVFHNFGIPDQRVKADAIPGQTTGAWFLPEDTGTYHSACYELCGQGHSGMNAEVVVMPEGEFQDWYANTSGDEANETATPAANGTESLGGVAP